MKTNILLHAFITFVSSPLVAQTSATVPVTGTIDGFLISIGDYRMLGGGLSKDPAPNQADQGGSPDQGPRSGGDDPMEPIWTDWMVENKIYQTAQTTEWKKTGEARDHNWANVVLKRTYEESLKSTWEVSASGSVSKGAFSATIGGKLIKEKAWKYTFSIEYQPYAGDVTTKIYSEMDYHSVRAYRKLLQTKIDPQTGDLVTTLLKMEEEWPCIKQVTDEPLRQHLSSAPTS